MSLDVHTLLVAVALALAVCAMARFVLWRLHPGIPGPASWAWASVLGVCCLGMLALEGDEPQAASRIVSQMLGVAAFLAVWDGYRRFIGRKRPSPVTVAVIGFLALLALLTAAHGIFPAIGLAVNPALMAVLSLLIAWDLLRRGRSSYLSMRLTGWVYVLDALLYGGRSAARALGFMQFRDTPGKLAAVTLLWVLFATIAVTLGMVLMTGERLQAELKRQAGRDPLTGALNRRAFVALGEKEMARTRRSGQPLAVLMMDLDHFKKINDCRGHSEGDAVLCQFVAVATRILRGEDLFCRFGGEEFVALLPGSSAAQAFAIAERLRVAFAREAAGAGNQDVVLSFAVTVSIGVHALQAQEALDDAIRSADGALYRAKAAGRNRCEMATPLALQRA